MPDAEQRLPRARCSTTSKRWSRTARPISRPRSQYQKTRAAFVADRVGAAALFGALAAALFFIALIGLTVGLIIALAPWLTPWGSSAVVVGAEFILALVFARMAANRVKRIVDVLGDRPEDGL